MKMNRKKTHNSTVGFLCIIAGLLCIAAAVLPQAMDRYREKKLLESLKQLQEEQADKAQEAQRPEENLPAGGNTQKPEEDALGGESSASGSAAGAEPAAGTVLGSLSIPAIGLEAPIREGARRASLKDALGHLSGTAPIGSETGNCAVAGHRNYTFGRFFNRLNEVKEGDSIIVTSTEGTPYFYEVTGIRVVEPEDVSVADSDGSGKLTLITCTPIYLATHRLIVSCALCENTRP